MASNVAKHKYVLYLTLIAMLWDILSGYLVHLLYPQHYLRFYPLIPIYFYLLNIISYLVVDAFKEKSTSSVMILLGSKMLKLFLSIALLLVYLLAIKARIVEFLVAFIGNYLFFLILDATLMIKYKPHKAALDNERVKNETVA